jgi:clan AA aspartic protease (TIGR02281 family)
MSLMVRDLKPAVCAGILALGLFIVMPVSSYALTPQAQEAATYFYNLSKGSANPLISGLAKESYLKLCREQGPTRQVSVPLLEQQDSSLALPIMIDGKFMATFMVDTGASYTVITPKMAEKLGVVITPSTPRISLMTGNGVVSAPQVTLRNISVGPVRVPEVKAVVQQLGDGHDLLLSGLLGLNFFKGMGFSVKNNMLILDVPTPIQTSMIP